MTQPTISLAFMPHEVMLVLEHPSGVLYRNQVAGVLCWQAEIEGVLASVDFSDADTERIMTLPWQPTRGITSDLADAVDSVLAAAPRARYLKVDRARLQESAEAWVFVIADTPSDVTEFSPGMDYFGSIFGFGITTGVLTWPNSD
jgi:hypothetical protein